MNISNRARWSRSTVPLRGPFRRAKWKRNVCTRTGGLDPQCGMPVQFRSTNPLRGSQENCKFRWLHAPAIKDTCSERSSDSVRTHQGDVIGLDLRGASSSMTLRRL
jgi:hypothetical protein